MPLPNTNPALNPAYQEGMHPNDIARMEIRQKKTNEMIANLNDRLADISSFGQSFQQGIYSSFGNNFVTRAAVGVPQMLGDVLDSFLLSDEDKKKKDPVGSALQDILDELHTIDEHLMKSFGSTIKDAFDEALSKMEQKEKGSSDCCEKSLDVLNKILDTINKAFGENQQKEEPVVDLKENAQIVPYKDFKASDFIKNDRMNSFEPTEVFEVNPNRIGYSAPEKKDTLSSRATNDSFIDVEPKPVVNRAVDAMLGTTGDKPINVNIVGAAIDRLNEMDKEMEKMVSIIPLSTAEQELESKKQETNIPKIQDATIKKEIKEEKKEESQKEAEPKKESSILGSAMDTLGGIAESYGLAKGAKAVLSKGGSLLGKIPKGVGLGAIASIGTDLAADYYGRDTKTGAGLDVVSDAAGMASTGAMIGSVVPGVGTAAGAVVGGIAGAGYGLYKNWDALFGSDKNTDIKVENKSTSGNISESELYKNDPENYKKYSEYKSNRYKELISSGEIKEIAATESKADAMRKFSKEISSANAGSISFSPDPALDKASMFERKTEELDASKSVNKTSDNSTQNNSVINNIKNTNIHPSRQGSKNTEPSYNRYLDTTFYFQGR